MNEIVKAAWIHKSGVFWYMLPTFRQCKVQYRRLKTALANTNGVLTDKSDTELSVTLSSGSTIAFRSAEVLDNLRTETLNGVVVDEVRDCHPDLWTMVLQPMLATTKGWAAFISTPRGYDQFYDLFEKAGIDKDWSRIQAPSTCNPLFSTEEFERLKLEMTEGQFDQEINAQFRDVASGRAYSNFHDGVLVDKNPFGIGGFEPYLPVVVAMDFNLSPMSWCIGQVNKGKRQWHWEKEIRLLDSHTEEAALELINHIPHNNPAGLWIVGDATGKAGQRAAGGSSDYDVLFSVLRQRGIKYLNMTPMANPGVKDRVQLVNIFCKNAIGQGNMSINRHGCPFLVKDLQRVTWKNGATYTLDSGVNDELTHMSDAIGYALHAITPLEGVRDVGVMRVIVR